MARIPYEIKQKDGVLIYPPRLSSLSSSPTPYYSVNYEKESNPSSAFSRISPGILLAIVILAAIFFISALLHLLVRFFIKRPSFSPIYQSNRYPETSGSNGLQRQLQHLFRLHDSGLDQASIDALPVFYYNDIMGLKEPFDCAICLCEFSDQHKLRLLPSCSHAFHIDCIDTWLLSNSTCPLCRGTPSSSRPCMEIPLFNFDVSRELSNGVSSDGETVLSSGQKPVTKEDNVVSKRVFSVRLGKFRSINDRENGGERRGQGEISSSCHLDARRCYSMGTFQYVVGDFNLQVALSPDSNGDGCGRDVKLVKGKRAHGCSSIDGDLEDKRISGRTKGDSFSISKIWLWPKKSRSPIASDAQMGLPSSSSLTAGLPSNDTTQIA